MKTNKRLQKLIPLALMLALLLTGCGETVAEPEASEEVEGIAIGEPLAENDAMDHVFSLNYAPEEPVNPLTTTSAANLLFSTLLYETPFVVSADYSFAPSRLITDYKTEDGGKTWTFTVNTQVQFSDGTYLTAYDISYSIRRAMGSTQYRNRLDNFSVVLGVSAYSEDTFMVTLYKENMLFPALLTIPVIKDGEAGVDCPVGTGLYKMQGAELWNAAEEEPGEETDPESTPAPDTGTAEPRLVVNELHPDAGSAPVDTIYLKAYEDAESIITAFEDSLIDLVENDPTGMSNLGYGSANEVRSYVSPCMHYLGFNMNSEFVLTAQYRYALSYGVDRRYIVDTLMLGDGVAAVSPIVPTSPLYNGANEDVIRYSPQSCLDALERGGCADYDEDGKLEYMVTGVPMEIDIDFIVNNESSVKVSAARKIAEDLRAMGITVTLRELSWTEFTTALEEGDFDMYYGEVMLTADFDLSRLLIEEGSLNYGSVTDPGYATRINAFLAADDAGRARACEDMCQYILSTAPIIPIAFESKDVITHRGVVSGMELSPYDVFHNVTEWTIQLD